MNLLILACLVLASPTPTTPARDGAPLIGADAEEFLRTAEVVAKEDIPVGVTRPECLTLYDGSRELRAAFKTIDEFKMRQVFKAGDRPIRDFRDSYKHEIAAYELDKLIGLGMVPPTVERRVGRDTGSLQLWVEGVMTEWDRQSEGRTPPDMEAWNRQIHNVRLFHQLTFNIDYRNARNLLVDRDFKIYIIDASRCFRLDHEVRKEEALERFDRSVLERLRSLTPTAVEDALGRWLTGPQIEALLARRDQIVARADELIAERGEAAVLFP